MTNTVPRAVRSRQGLFGALVLLVFAACLLALIGPGTPLARYLADRDAGVSVTGTVTQAGVDFSCFSPRSLVLGNSPVCHGVRVAVSQSGDPVSIPVGTVIAVSTKGDYVAGDVFTGKTAGTSHRNLTTTLSIIAVILAVCGLIGAARCLFGRRSPQPLLPRRAP